MDAASRTNSDYPKLLRVIVAAHRDGTAPLSEPNATYIWEAADEIERLRTALKLAAEAGHKTIVPSKLHDPQRLDFTECPTIPCKAASEALGGR